VENKNKIHYIVAVLFFKLHVDIFIKIHVDKKINQSTNLQHFNKDINKHEC